MAAFNEALYQALDNEFKITSVDCTYFTGRIFVGDDLRNLPGSDYKPEQKLAVVKVDVHSLQITCNICDNGTVQIFRVRSTEHGQVAAQKVKALLSENGHSTEVEDFSTSRFRTESRLAVQPVNLQSLTLSNPGFFKGSGSNFLQFKTEHTSVKIYSDGSIKMEGPREEAAKSALRKVAGLIGLWNLNSTNWLRITFLFNFLLFRLIYHLSQLVNADNVVLFWLLTFLVSLGQTLFHENKMLVWRFSSLIELTHGWIFY